MSSSGVPNDRLLTMARSALVAALGRRRDNDVYVNVPLESGGGLWLPIRSVGYDAELDVITIFTDVHADVPADEAPPQGPCCADERVVWLRAQLDDDERLAREEGFGRVLRAVAAYRDIVDWVVARQSPGSTVGDDYWFALVRVAAIYADRPGYAQVWGG